MDSIAYSYKHGFSGFAAMLTEEQAENLAGAMVLAKKFSLNFSANSLLTLPLPVKMANFNMGYPIC